MRDERVHTEPDFVLAPKFGNSLAKFMERYPAGVTSQVGARVLGITEEEFLRIRDEAHEAMRNQI